MDISFFHISNEIQNALNSLGFFKDQLDFIAGLPPIKADPLVIEKLKETDSLINIEDYKNGQKI